MILLEVILIFGMLYTIWLFLYSMLFGAPYAAIGKKRLATMMHLSKVQKGEKAADLGSGDGRIVRALAKKGAYVDGFEINPVPYAVSRYLLKKDGVANAHIFLRDLWRVDLASYDVITLYGNFPMMHRLEKKLQKELRPGARVISNHFQFPNWKFVKKEDDVYLYVR